MMTQMNSQSASHRPQASRSAITRLFRVIVSALVLFAFTAMSVRTRADDKMRTTPVPSVSTTIPTVPLMVPLQKGSVAPWTGVLLNAPAVAQIAVDTETADKECGLKTDAAVEKEKAFADTRLKDKDAEKKYVQDTLSAQIKTRDDEIARLQKEKVSSATSPLWWGIGGAAGGIVLTVTIVFLVNFSQK